MSGQRERVVFAVGLAATLALLFYATRGAPLGVPVADDYLFLFRQRFGPFDLFDSAGAAWYWRPVSRQFYFALLGPWLPEQPAVAVAAHAALLATVAIGLWSFARRHLPPAAALGAALFPLLVEPARTLLGWPSGSQHLLPMAGVSIAIGAAAWGRLALALGGAAVALLGIESAALVLPLVPLAAATDRGPSRRTWLIATVGLGAGWLALRAFAASRGVIVPEGLAHLTPEGVSATLKLALRAQLGLEDLAPATASALAVGYAIALGGALLPARRGATDAAEATGATGRSGVPLAGLALVGLLWWIAGVAPLAGIQPNWNAWRSCLPGLGLGIACAALLARGRTWTLVLFLSVRALALALAAPAPPGVLVEPLPSASHLSFTRLVRLQRTVELARAALREPPAIPRGARVRYWNFPRMSEFAFAGDRAARVWLADSTLGFSAFGEREGVRDTGAVVLMFDVGLTPRAARLRPEVQRLLWAADRAIASDRSREADSCLALALASQPGGGQRLRAVANGNRVWVLLRLGRVERADSLHALTRGEVPEDEWLRAEAWIGLGRADTVRAARAVEQVLAVVPADGEMLDLARLLRMR